MTDTTADRWEFSVLVDQASRILEGRGMFEHYLGARGAQIAGRHLLSYIDESERLPFLRYMARLLVRGEAEPVSATLRTPAVGIKRFSMAAKVAAEGQRNWWIMFAQEGKAAPERPALDNEQPSIATEQEIGLIAAAHDHAAAPLDITVFHARALGDGGSSSLSPETRKAIDEKFSEQLQEHAHQRIVARPTAGEYALLHRRNKDVSDIRERLVAVAAEHNVAADALGLTQATYNLSAEVDAADVIRDIRRKLQRPAAESTAMPLAASAPHSRMPIYVAAGCILAVIAVALVLRGWM